MEGPVLVAEAAEAGVGIVEQFVLADDPVRPVGGGEILPVDAAVLALVSDVETPRGPVAVCRIPDGPSLADVDGWVLVADAVSDPGNLGTIARCAEIAGASAVVVTAGTTDPWSPKCIRASAGATFHVPVVEVDSLEAVRTAGFEVLATTSHPGIGDDSGPQTLEMGDCDFSGRIAIVLGNESRGVPRGAPVDKWITIRHVGRGESLNVAMAGAILSMHAARDRARRAR